MTSKYYTILTHSGVSKMANALVNNTKVQLMTFAVGDGNGSFYSPKGSETILKGEKWRGNISAINTDPTDATLIKLECAVPANVGGFTIREIGIFDDEGTLIAIGNYPDTPKTIVNDGIMMDMLIYTILKVTNTTAIAMSIDPSFAIASRNYVVEQVTPINTQLVQTTTQVAALETNKADIKYVNQQVQAANVAFKESYNTLTELQSVYPNGDTFNHGVLSHTDSNGVDIYTIYTWSNNTWANTNIQANGSGLADSVVTPEKTTFLNSDQRNLYNPETSKDGYRLSDANGAMTFVDATATGSDYIAVKNGNTYKIAYNDKSKGYRIFRTAGYDSSKNFLKYIFTTTNTTGNLTFTADFDGYIRCGLSLDGKNELYIVDTQYDEGFIPFKYILDNDVIIKTGGEKITSDDTNFVQVGKNLFNKSDVTQNTLLYYQSGRIAENAAYSTSDFIKIHKGTDYSLTNFRNCVVYNAYKNYVVGYDGTAQMTDITFTSPCDGYLRASCRTNLIDTAQIEIGSTTSNFEPYSIEIKNLKTADLKTTSLMNDVTVYKNGDKINIRSHFSDSQDIFIETKRQSDTNNQFNFERTTLVSKDYSQENSFGEITGETFHDNWDDTNPITTWYSVAGNHGYTVLEVSGTGKTVADLGSVWTDGEREFTLLRVDASSMLFLFPSTYSNGVTNVITTLPTNNLNHAFGATNTNTIQMTNPKNVYLFPSISKHNVDYTIDGKKIIEDGIYYGKSFKVTENFETIDYHELSQWCRNNIGLDYRNFINDLETDLKLSITYDFRKGGSCVVYNSLRALKRTYVSTWRTMQAIPLVLSGYDKTGYLPNTLPKNGYDFRNVVDITNYNTTTVWNKADYENPSIPPHRYVTWLTKGGLKKVGFTMGFIIDKTDSKNSKRLTLANQAWDLRDTKKSYPVAIKEKTLAVGECYSFIGYRNYLAPHEKPNATNITTVDVGKDTYIYIDYHESVSFESIIFSEHVGKEMVILEKNDNFTLHNEVIDANGVLFSVSNNYGYAILKVS